MDGHRGGAERGRTVTFAVGDRVRWNAETRKVKTYQVAYRYGTVKRVMPDAYVSVRWDGNQSTGAVWTGQLEHAPAEVR